ncbi:hypothetical protein [Actinoplanes couchii]|uniref:Uncharacterized protein n=1 Tax=Actinoplanes couchii TaxID=403638 RepID=A0ABQ3WZM1_9ACTN|nr:hypothetical protein [Actinoplanes couchii]MDR6316110.1 hypothetical protein [Actinoplanes couchii]GID51725.1 hypothetical protein Aco03nite_001290 [Actinoplanes couchii]
MNRTVRYAAGLMIAAGASLAIAGPATAAPSNDPFGSRDRGSDFSSSRSYFDATQIQKSINTNVNTQVVLNNIGNVQIGRNNYNGGGTAFALNETYQGGRLDGGNFRQRNR